MRLDPVRHVAVAIDATKRRDMPIPGEIGRRQIDTGDDVFADLAPVRKPLDTRHIAHQTNAMRTLTKPVEMALPQLSRDGVEPRRRDARAMRPELGARDHRKL